MTTPSLQCYNAQLPSIPTLWKFTFRSQHFFGYGKPKDDQHIISWFPYMATFGEASEWESATTLGQHTLSSSGSSLQTHGQGHSTYYTFHFTWRVNRRYRFNLDTVFSYKSLCNSYRITYTSRIKDLLLLFLLVLTCQISAPTFTTRHHATYNCGWWCRGSTHLQMWQQGPTAFKTLWESWPVYRTYTYMDRESI